MSPIYRIGFILAVALGLCIFGLVCSLKSNKRFGSSEAAEVPLHAEQSFNCSAGSNSRLCHWVFFF